MLAAGCGGGRRAGFCGLVRTVNGFDPVAAVHGTSCGDARSAVAAVERNDRGAWLCSRAMHASYELDCRAGAREVRVLERAPVPATRRRGVVTLANWSFRLARGRIEGRAGSGGWIDLGGPPFCEPTVPREALIALRLRPLTPAGGCFAPTTP